MSRLAWALGGLAALGAVAAFFYVKPGPAGVEESELERYNLAPGDVRVEGLEPGRPGEAIRVTVSPSGPIDVYVVEAEWTDPLLEEGRLDLSGPFSFHAEWSRVGLAGEAILEIPSDGVTAYRLLLDHSDNFYDGDAVPDGAIVHVDVEVRYPDRESHSLLLGYLATLPSILLVAFTVARKVRRRRRLRAAPGAGALRPP